MGFGQQIQWGFRIGRKNFLAFYDRAFVEDPEGLDSISWNMMKKYRPVDCELQIFPINKLRSTFVVTKDEVKKLKNFILNKQPNLDYISSFAVISAYICVCLAKSAAALRLEEVGADEPEYFSYAANCRALLSPPLPDAYFGNCAVFVIAESKHGELIAKWNGKRVFSVAGSSRFDLYDADFGWGKAKKYEFVHIDKETSMSFCKSSEFQGGFDIGLSRPKIEMDAFAAVFTEGLNNITME